MNRISHLAALAALALGAATATAGDAPAAAAAAPLKAPEASIPFTNVHGSIRDWQADKRDGIWVQDVHKQWYYGRFMGPCIGLDFAMSVGFDTRHGNTLDKFAYVIVPGEHDRCALASFVKSDPPPPGKKRRNTADKTEDARVKVPATPPKAP